MTTAVAACSTVPPASATASGALLANSGQTPSADLCGQALPVLEQAALGEQTGHIAALKMLRSCYQLLGQAERAQTIGWFLDGDLNRGDPHDE
ncbi:MAG TPA: hypothetical protein VL462_00095 [Candidatus Nitrosotalea sp.]|nr:hypothetical protein [Candidatus Nitrosotalea sp.]